MQLGNEIERFKHWATTRDPLTAKYFPSEWECDYPHWGEMYEAVRIAIDGELNERLAQDILYALARDNEDEFILEMLEERPKKAIYLAEQAIKFPDREARWQIAVVLGRIGSKDADRILANLEQDEDEYVRRRAKSSKSDAGT